MGWFGNKNDEQKTVVREDQVDKKNAELERQGRDVCGEKTKGGKVEITHRPAKKEK